MNRGINFTAGASDWNPSPSGRIGMRCRGLLACGIVLCAGTSASAGLYNSSEPEVAKLGRDNFILVFRDTLLHLRTIGMREVPIDNTLRKRYLLQAILASWA